jgi:hypothetical protein
METTQGIFEQGKDEGGVVRGYVSILMGFMPLKQCRVRDAFVSPQGAAPMKRPTNAFADIFFVGMPFAC